MGRGKLYTTGQPGVERPPPKFKKPTRDSDLRDEHESDDEEDLDARERARRKARWDKRFSRYASCCVFPKRPPKAPKATREDAPREEAVDAAMEAAFAEDADAAAADAAAADDPDAADDPGDAPARKSVAFADAPGEDEDAATVAAYYAAKGRELLYKGRDPPKEKRRSSSRAKRDGDGEATDRGEKRERRRSSRKEKKKRASLSEKTDDDVDDFLKAEATVACAEAARSGWFGACTAPAVEEEEEYLVMKPVVPEAAPDVEFTDVAPPRGGLCMG